MSGLNLVARVEDLVSDAVVKFSFGEDVDYAVVPGLAPLPGGVQPVLCIAVTLPALTVGDFMIATKTITTVRPNADVVESTVQELVQGLISTRTQQAHPNGHQPPAGPSGLILPPGA